MIFQVNKSLVIASLFILFFTSSLDGVSAAQLRGDRNTGRNLIGCPVDRQYCPEQYPGFGSHIFEDCKIELSSSQIGECVYDSESGALQWSTITNNFGSSSNNKKSKGSRFDTSGYDVCHFSKDVMLCE